MCEPVCAGIQSAIFIPPGISGCSWCLLGSRGGGGSVREDWRVLMSCVLTGLRRAQGETSDPADAARALWSARQPGALAAPLCPLLP